MAVVAILFASCGASSDDPKTVLITFFERIAKKDLDGAAKLATADSKSTIDMLKKGIEMAEKMNDSLAKNDPVKDFQDVEFGDAKIDGDRATVTVTHKNKKDQPPADFSLVKENGKWKVDFSMAALMKMGQQQIDNDATPTEVTPESLDSLNIGADQLQQAQKSLDSVMKNIDPKQLEEIQKQLEKIKTPQ